ncbi:hypothetical protein C9374_010993 [Naegleria lovaniensis]|uniref:Uncharacterized protein n=1 Tax=Naegleria lovaniensis TaxID=51637 RepID=A0AA88GCU4_NAELO|nr:uncharacterized protein C9374_010993 [Naegleria lovaniensis]KAG2374156.1 hypothetical protein C9374_010993 [Naegleria lovaniensis]
MQSIQDLTLDKRQDSQGLAGQSFNNGNNGSESDGYCSCPEMRCLFSIALVLLWLAVSIVYFVMFTSDRIVIQRHHSFTVNQFNNNSRMFICPCSNEEIAYDSFVKVDIEVEFPVLINQMDNSSTHMCNGSKLNQVSSKACISFLKGFTEVLGSSTFFSPYLVTEKDIEERIRRFARLTSNEIMMTLLFGSEIASDVLAQLQGADTRYKNPRSLQSSLENQRKNLQTFQNTTMELFIATLPNVTIDHAKYFKECDALYCDERRHLNGYEIMFNVVAKVGGWMSISMVTAGVLLSILNCVAKSFYKDKPVRDIF